MLTQNLIQAQANIITITSLRKGDVFKLVDDSSYSGPRVYYAVALDLLNDGSKTYVQILKYKADYGALDTSIELISGDKEVHIFPATKAEVSKFFNESIEVLKNKISDKEDELLKYKKGLVEAHRLVKSAETAKLSLVGFEEVPNTEAGE